MIWGLKSVFAGLHWYFSLFCMSAFPLFVISSILNVHYMWDVGWFVVRAVDIGILFFVIILGDLWRGEWRWVGKGACGGFTFDKCVYRKSWLWCMAMISDRLKAVIGSVSPPLSCWWAANIWGMAFMLCPLKTWSTQQEI